MPTMSQWCSSRIPFIAKRLAIPPHHLRASGLHEYRKAFAAYLRFCRKQRGSIDTWSSKVIKALIRDQKNRVKHQPSIIWCGSSSGKGRSIGK